MNSSPVCKRKLMISVNDEKPEFLNMEKADTVIKGDIQIN